MNKLQYTLVMRNHPCTRMSLKRGHAGDVNALYLQKCLHTMVKSTTFDLKRCFLGHGLRMFLSPLVKRGA